MFPFSSHGSEKNEIILHLFFLFFLLFFLHSQTHNILPFQPHFNPFLQDNSNSLADFYLILKQEIFSPWSLHKAGTNPRFPRWVVGFCFFSSSVTKLPKYLQLFVSPKLKESTRKYLELPVPELSCLGKRDVGSSQDLFKDHFSGEKLR